MNISEIRQLIENEKGKIIIIEDGEPVMVVMSFEEYLERVQKEKSGKLFSSHNEEKEQKVPAELEEEDLKVEDLPF